MTKHKPLYCPVDDPGCDGDEDSCHDACERPVKERPILFSGSMVRAILDGRKGQTRRIIKPQPELCTDLPGKAWYQRNRRLLWCDYTTEKFLAICPYGKPGDRLWVRETWTDLGVVSGGHFKQQAIFAADNIERYGDFDDPWSVEANAIKWRPSIHMPRWASRILLEVTDVRVERLQDISEEDAKAEGAERGISPEDSSHFDEGDGYFPPSSHIQGFANLWDGINADRGHGWESNPWVWVVSFKILSTAKEVA